MAVDNGPRNSSVREATLSAVVFGLIFGVIMNASITYAGLKIGFTIVSSAIGAVLGFGVLRGILRKGSILEINIAQTVGSAISSSCAGIIFTVPVLFLLKDSEPTMSQLGLLVLAGVVGAVLGVAFIIPLRKQMIDIDRLRFPNGTAVAAILKAPGAGPRKSIVLLVGGVIAALIYLPVALPGIKVGGEPLPGYGDLVGPFPALKGILSHDELNVGAALGLPAQIPLIFAITPLSFGAGYLTGRPGLMVLVGGILAFFILSPIAYTLNWMPATVGAADVAEYSRDAFNRPLGIGLLLGGALMGVLASLPVVREALRSIRVAGRTRQGSDELGLNVLLLAVLGAVALLYVASNYSLGEDTSGGLLAGLGRPLRSLIIALVGAVWIWFAGIIIAQCTGLTDWSPISGMALLTVVLVMFLAGPGEVVGAVLLGAALCVATSGAADMMADLKTGYLVGGRPARQQALELAAAWIGPIVSIATLLLIVAKNQKSLGIPLGPGTPEVAPQAEALKTIIQGVQGGEMPYALYGFGALLGVLMGLGSFPGLGVLVGLSMYLPVVYVLTYGLGCLVNMAVSLIKGKVWAEEWGVPFCAGLIVGEAILALTINLFILLLG
jgi:putative OPT family oligopeptide transporter